MSDDQIKTQFKAIAAIFSRSRKIERQHKHMFAHHNWMIRLLLFFQKVFIYFQIKIVY